MCAPGVALDALARDSLRLPWRPVASPKVVVRPSGEGLKAGGQAARTRSQNRSAYGSRTSSVARSYLHSGWS